MQLAATWHLTYGGYSGLGVVNRRVGDGGVRAVGDRLLGSVRNGGD